MDTTSMINKWVLTWPVHQPTTRITRTHGITPRPSLGATVAGFEALSEDCSSEHSREDSESITVGSTHDDDSGDKVVPETQTVAHTATSSTSCQHENLDELPEWADDEELDMWSASIDVIRCGMYFKGKDELNHAVRLWNIARGMEIIIVDSTKHVYKVRCYSTHHDNMSYSGEQKCRWLVRASKKKTPRCGRYTNGLTNTTAIVRWSGTTTRA